MLTGCRPTQTILGVGPPNDANASRLPEIATNGVRIASTSTTRNNVAQRLRLGGGKLDPIVIKRDTDVDLDFYS